MVTPGAPRFEHLREALGIGVATPRLSWKTVAPALWRQSAYQVEIVRGGTRWTGSRTESTESVLVPWPAQALASREHAEVRIKVFGAGEDGIETESEWSEPGLVEAGLLHPGDWSALPVGGAWPEEADSDDRRPALVRRTFRVGANVARARLYATAHGLYEAELNGRRVGDDTLSPAGPSTASGCATTPTT